MIEVFFDGKCGLCSKEIAYYQRIAPSGIFVWMDIATDASPLAAHQISQADALRYLHVRDAAGNWHIGAAAFLVIWQQLRYWRFLALLVGLPIFRQIAAMVYNRFADYRLIKLAIARLPKRIWHKYQQAIPQPQKLEKRFGIYSVVVCLCGVRLLYANGE